MKKLNTTTYQYATKVSTYSQYKVVELNDGFLLNTVYHHNKETFEPTTRQSYNNSFTGSQPENNLILDRHINYIGSLYSKWFRKDCIIPDLYNPNIYYVFSDNFIGKYEEKDGIMIELQKKYNGSGEWNYYLGQNEEYLFISSVYGSSKYIYKFLKTTLANTSMGSYYIGNRSYIGRPTVIKETTNYIYFYQYTTSGGSNYNMRLHISKIDKVTSTYTLGDIIETVSNNSASNVMNSMSDAVIKINENSYGIIIKYLSTSTAATDYFKFIKLDFIDESNPTITISALNTSGFTVPTKNSFGESIFYYVYSNIINGTEYLYLIRNAWNSGSDSENVIDRYFAMHTLRINKNTSGIPVSLTQIDFMEGDICIDSDINSYIISQDGKVIVFWCKKGFYIMKADDTTGKFSLIQTMTATNIKTFGIDKLNRIWVMYTDFSVALIGLTDFSSYVVEFEKDGYAYTGEDINTFVKMKCLDVLNNRMDASFNLTIVGNAVFDDTNSKVITVTTHTTDTDDIKVPITINGAGRIIVYPTLVID